MSQLNNTWSLRFWYNNTGRGNLELLKFGAPKKFWPARTGSMRYDKNSDLVLVNAIVPGDWYIVDKPENPHISEIDLMHVKGKPGLPFKLRLWPYPTHREHEKISRYLIHADGSKGNLNDGNGSDGCIVTADNAPYLRRAAYFLYDYYPNDIFKVDVRKI